MTILADSLFTATRIDGPAVADARPMPEAPPLRSWALRGWARRLIARARPAPRCLPGTACCPAE
ncbi:hypothetical protein [Paralimibaculum aggregatum]|nr:hypothetical protein [Limibaculum sp. NKW23]